MTQVQEVTFGDNNVTYKHGPFVISSTLGGFRVEAERKGHHCPVLPDPTIYRMCEQKVGPLLKTTKERAKKQAAYLNEQVKLGAIVLQGKTWVAPAFERTY